MTVRFGDRDVELRLSVAGGVPVAWPTDVMREWVALCGGTLSLDVTVGGPGGAECLQARLPRRIEEIFA